MKRREFFGVLSGAAFLSSTSAFAQQPKKMARIGVLWHGANAEQEAIYLSIAYALTSSRSACTE